MLERDVVPVDSKRVSRATSQALKRKCDIRTQASNLIHDPDLGARTNTQKCVVCFYLNHRIVQQAFFSQPCGICEVPQTYCNSDTNILCLKCAQEHGICRHCGADFNLNEDRTFKGNDNGTSSESI